MRNGPELVAMRDIATVLTEDPDNTSKKADFAYLAGKLDMNPVALVHWMRLDITTSRERYWMIEQYLWGKATASDWICNNCDNARDKPGHRCQCQSKEDTQS